MIKREIVETVTQVPIKSHVMSPPTKIEEIVEPIVKTEVVENIPAEFLVKSEQVKIKKKEKRKKFKNLWKDHKKVLKLMSDEEKSKMDIAKKKALMIAEQFEYEDEYDDVELEKQVSIPMDANTGNFYH